MDYLVLFELVLITVGFSCAFLYNHHWQKEVMAHEETKQKLTGVTREKDAYFQQLCERNNIDFPRRSP